MFAPFGNKVFLFFFFFFFFFVLFAPLGNKVFLFRVDSFLEEAWVQEIRQKVTKNSSQVVSSPGYHYEDTPIQIYRKYHLQKLKNSDKNSDIFHISAQNIIFLISVQNIDRWYSLEPPRRGGSNEYPLSMFLSRNNFTI